MIIKVSSNFSMSLRGESESPAYLQLKRTISEVNALLKNWKILMTSRVTLFPSSISQVPESFSRYIEQGQILAKNAGLNWILILIRTGRYRWSSMGFAQTT